MLRVLGCVTEQHDVWLVGVAALVCALACVTSLSLLGRGLMAGGTWLPAWRAGAAVTFGGGVWATHFIAMLAYRAGQPFGVAVPLTIGSLLLPMLGAMAAFAMIARAPRATPARLAAGVALGVSVAAMHFTGMAALRIAARVVYDPATCLAAVAIGLTFGCLAMFAHRGGRLLPAASLLGLAVCGMHFTAMSAVTLIPYGDAPPPVGALAQGQLGLGIALVAAMILACGLIASLLDARRVRELEAEAGLLRRLLAATFEGILFHRDGVVTEVNAQLCALLGRRREGLVGQSVLAVLAGANLPEAAVDGAAVSLETELRDSAGGSRAVELLAKPLGDALRGDHVIAVRDISERKRAEQRIQHLAFHDTLTGLANRALLADAARQALAVAERGGQGVALLSLDLDGLKAVNDMLGRRAGDQLLQAAAKRLAGTVRQTDTLARIGGDEFAILEGQVELPQAAEAMAERIVRVLAEPFDVGGHGMVIGVSIGVALYPADGRTLEDLLRNADLALQRAKQAGKGTHRFFEPGMDARMRERRQLELDLHDALANNEFELHYQAQFDTVTLAEVGYEALLRWDNPRLGRVSPAVFIPIAESSGLIRDIGHWVLKTACQEAAGWARPLRVAVNLSPAQFKWPDLPERILDVLASTGLPASRLELEITEGVLVEDSERALAMLRQVKAHGTRLALDDFGTGYSSLSYLRRFPFDSLKIDQSFVSALGEDAEADAIVRAVVGLGRSLNLDVIAEGVETPQQLAHLRALHCHQVQGFLLARPVPAGALAHMPVAARA